MGWGDELMVTGQVRELQRTDPRKVRVVYERPRWHEAWANNPRIAGPGESGDFQTLDGRINGLRPYMQSKQPTRWAWRAYGPPVGELYFSEAERQFGQRWSGRVVLEPALKPGASQNKQWGRVRWQALADLLKLRGIEPAQLGPSGTPILRGVEHIVTPGMRHAAAVMDHARAAVLPEGGLHHVAAAVATPAVVIFGGYIAPEVTGYPGQRSLFEGGEAHPLGCGWRSACQHCSQAMSRITPERVLRELEEIL